jgi:hypothetical protein
LDRHPQGCCDTKNYRRHLAPPFNKYNRVHGSDIKRALILKRFSNVVAVVVVGPVIQLEVQVLLIVH